ncbi:MAG TPA: hypothetical protein PK677_17800 [Acidiphilium sp.]|nr:hypothetical protein [Acidiphilium sp.]
MIEHNKDFIQRMQKEVERWKQEINYINNEEDFDVIENIKRWICEWDNIVKQL